MTETGTGSDETAPSGSPLYGSHVALIVVDVQNDFAHPEGSLFVTTAPRIIDAVNEAARSATSTDALVVRTQDWHPASTPHFHKDGGIWPVHCVRDTWGASFDDRLEATGPVVRKGTGGEDGYSGFTVRDPESGAEEPTGLHEILREGGITDVVICGLATDYCVKETALDAVRLGYRTTLLADAIGAVDIRAGDGARAIAAMYAAGVAVV
jgi:nicotinamidase/pyrazinamidase